MDPYYSPDEFGLEIVGEIEWMDEPFEFDMTVVWRDPSTGQFYAADDSGCSCPSPFEGFHARADLVGPMSKGAVLAYLRAKGEPAKSVDLAERIRRLPQPCRAS